jgi:AraC-like DNA-binding protein
VRETESLCRALQSYLVEFDAKLEFEKRLGSSDRERRLLDFIDQRLLDNPSVSDVSAYLKLSKSRTSHFIKELTGRSLRELKEQRRLRRAQDLLAATALSVKEVAVQCGFNDENYFCRYFRLKAGSSPLTFRRETRSRQSP